MGTTIATISTAPEFAALNREWNGVLTASRTDSPFLRHELLQLWWEVFGEGRSLHVLTCRDDAGALLGALPMYEEARRPMLKARVMRLLGDARAGATGLGPFALAEAEAEVLDAFAQHLREHCDWDVLDWRFVDASAPLFERTLHGPSGSCAIRNDVHATPVVNLPDDFERYLMEVLPAKKRESLRRCRRRTEAAGAVVEIVDDPAQLEAALEDGFRLFRERMRVVVESDFEISSDSHEFSCRVAAQLLEQRRLRLGFLVAEGKRIAYAQLFRYGDTLYAMRSGFDPEWGRLEVLKALNSHMIERGIVEGCRRLDLGLGDQAYKQGWGVAETRRFSDVRVYSGSVASAAWQAATSMVDWGVDAALAAPEGVRKPLLGAGKRARRMLGGR